METTYTTTLHRILVVNPRTCFTKIAIYDNNKLIYLNKLNHNSEDCHKYPKILDQHEFRRRAILDDLKKADIDIDKIVAVVGRGGYLKPLKSGIYEVNELMKYDLKHNPAGEDSVNLGALLVDDIAKTLGHARAFISNPIVVDELDDIARISGHPLFPRKSIFHALNQKATARGFARQQTRRYEEMRLIVAHLGVGITVGAHKEGRVVDVNQGFDGYGPFSPKRSGTLPAGDLVRLCFSGKYSKEEVEKMVMGDGGLVAWMGTEDVAKVERMAYVEGDVTAKLIFEAMAYNVAKEIASLSAVFSGKLDAILLTGGIANSQRFVQQIIDRVKFIAPVHVFPGGDEMEALAFNVLAALRGERPISIYQ